MNQQVIKLLIALIGVFLFFLGVDCLPKRKNKGQTVKKGIIEEIDSGNCSTDDSYIIYVTVGNKKIRI